MFLEWIRKKYKNTDIQFQGKIQDPLRKIDGFLYLHTLQMMMRTRICFLRHLMRNSIRVRIVILASANEDPDTYDPHINCYTNLKTSEYETLYQEWTFADADDEEDDAAGENDEDIEEEEEYSEDEDEQQDIVQISKPIHSRSKNVFVECALRDKVVENFTESLGRW